MTEYTKEIMPKADRKPICQAEKCAKEAAGWTQIAGMYCVAHRHIFERYGNADHKTKNTWIRDTATETHKYCSSCLEFKPFSDFAPNKNYLGGVTAKCRICTRICVREWEKNRSAKAIANSLELQQIGKVRRKYGAEGLAVRERIKSGEPCEICGGYTERMAIDHCHDTGKVRGLLCAHCNTALGLLKEDPTVLNKMIEYLKTHNPKG